MARRPYIPFLLPALACSQASEPAWQRASIRPELAEHGDRADHECQVVLRTVYRQPVGEAYETDCSSGACLFVWRGQVEVAESVPGDSALHVLYRLSSDAEWWNVRAEPVLGGAPGFAGFTFRISEHLFGPDTPGTDGLTVELIPYLVLPDGTRLFDHNRYSDNLANHALTARDYFGAGDGGVCVPVAGTTWFADTWEEGLRGPLRQGGYLVVQYDIDRLPDCRGTHNGYPAWDIVAHARFQPGGQLLSGTVRELEIHNGQPTNNAHDRPWIVKVPDDATSVELWFRNYTGAGSSCVAWDSAYGANYRFDIWPPATHPRCRDLEQWTRIYGGEPHCLDADINAQYDANHCELSLDGIGHGYEGHYGIPFEWLEAYLRVRPQQDGEVLGAGLFARYLDPRDGASHVRFSLGTPVAPDIWKTGFTYHATGVMGPPSQTYAFTVEQMAFFLDVRRPGSERVRLWQSRGGANYTWDDAFSLPTTAQSIPYGNIVWSNEGSAIFDSRRRCR